MFQFAKVQQLSSKPHPSPVTTGFTTQFKRETHKLYIRNSELKLQPAGETEKACRDTHLTPTPELSEIKNSNMPSFVLQQ